MVAALHFSAVIMFVQMIIAREVNLFAISSILIGIGLLRRKKIARYSSIILDLGFLVIAIYFFILGVFVFELEFLGNILLKVQNNFISFFLISIFFLTRITILLLPKVKVEFGKNE